MARYFSVNSLAGAKRSATTVVDVTTAARFDSGYVASAILIPQSIEFFEIGAPFLDGSASVATMYLRFDVWGTATMNGNAGVWITWYNGGIPAYRLIGNNVIAKIQYWNSGTSTWVDWGASVGYGVGASTLTTVMLKLTANSLFEFYVGGTLVATTSGSTAPSNAQTAITAVRFGNISGGNAYYSQVMAADYDIRDAHHLAAAITGDSAVNVAGTGAYTDVNELVLDDTTSIKLPTVGNKKGQTKAAITVPAGVVIAGLVINARGRASGGAVTDGKLGVRSGGTNYSSSGRTYNGGYEPRGAIWETDPATGAGFTQTGFNNAEAYLEAA